VGAVIVPRRDRLLGTLPPRAAPPHETTDVPRAHAPVRHPPAVLALSIATLPGREDRAPPRRVCLMEGHVRDHANPRPPTGGAVGSLVIGHAPGVLRRRPRLPQQGLLACCAPAARGQSVGVPGRAVGRMGPPALCRDAAREVRVLLAHLSPQACGGLPCASLWVGAIGCDARFRPQRPHCPHGWLDERCTHQRMSRGDTPVAVHLLQTRRPVKRRGGTRPRASTRHSSGALPTRPLFPRLAAREWPKAAGAPRAEPRGGDRSQDRAPVRVPRDRRKPIEGVPMARCPCLVTGESSGRCAGNPGDGRQQHSGSRDLRIAKASLWEGGKAASTHAQERLSGKRRAPFGGNTRQGHPRPGDRTWFR
jgi:hypothetical protein